METRSRSSKKCWRAGEIKSAWETAAPAFAKGKPKQNGLAAAGLRFEKSSLSKLAQANPFWKMRQSVWFEYEADGGEHICEVDGLLAAQGNGRPKLIVVECKLKQQPAAIEELRFLYMPVLKAAIPEAVVCGVHLFKVPVDAKWESKLIPGALKENEIISVKAP